MLAKLSGKIDAIKQDSIIINVQGLGFQVLVPATDLHTYTEGTQVDVHTEMLWRQDSVALVGFTSEVQKEWFHQLLKVQGVGAKSALAVLSALPPERIHEAIMNHETAAFTQADGIGPKVATRIVNELQSFAQKHPGDYVPSATNAEGVPPHNNSEIVQTLLTLGYKKHEAQRVVNQVARDNKSSTIEELVSLAIKELSKGML